MDTLLENRTSMMKHFHHKWFRIRHKICFMTNLWRIWVRRRRSVIFDTRWRIIIFRHKCLILPWRFVVSHITWLFSWQEQIITVFVMKPTCHVPSSMLAYDMASDDVVATWHHLRWQMTWHRPHRQMTWLRPSMTWTLTWHLTWRVTWQLTWQVKSASQPSFERAQFIVGLISTLIHSGPNFNPPVFPSHLLKQKFHSRNHNKQLQPIFRITTPIFTRYKTMQ